MRMHLGVMAVAALALTCAAARADDAPMRPVAGSVEPVQRTDIVMEKELVGIRVSDAEHTLIVVDCTFWFHNTGKATTVLMGFPAFSHYAGDPTKHPGRALRATPESAFDPITLHDFLTFVGDRQVPVKLKRGLRKDERWVTWSLDFAAGERKVVRNRYWVNEGSSAFWYLLHTGAGWKGKIGEAKVIIENGLDEFGHLREAGGLDRLTPGYRTQGRDVVWELRDFEPTFAHDIAWPIGLGGPDSIDVLPHASSWLPASQEAFYGPDFAFDGAPATCWAVKGPGVGQWIKGATNWNAGTSQFVGIDILPGYAANQATWQENNRAAKISIVALHYPTVGFGQETGKPRTVTHSANLRDEMKVQRVHFDPPIITYPSEIKVFIAGIHRGSKHDRTCISEIGFAEAGRLARSAAAEASANLPTNRFGIVYFPGNAGDGHRGTAWAVPKGPGEWIRVELGEPKEVSRIGVIPGYAKSGDLWRKNNRVRTARLDFSDGSSQTATFQDKQEMQWISIKPRTVKWLKLTVQSVYAGSKWNDTCISEIAVE